MHQIAGDAFIESRRIFLSQRDPDDFIRDSGEHFSLPVHKLFQDVACPLQACVTVGLSSLQGGTQASTPEPQPSAGSPLCSVCNSMGNLLFTCA